MEAAAGHAPKATDAPEALERQATSELEVDPQCTCKFSRFDIISLASFIGLSATSLYIVVHSSQTHHDLSRYFTFLAVLLGPVGCLLRWHLARLNYKLSGAWAWFPSGTFLANMLACTLNFAIAASLERRHRALSGRDVAALTAVMAGVSGALSTVSTWVVEVQQLLTTFPKELHGYTYVAISLGTSLTFGALIYGISVWA